MLGQVGDFLNYFFFFIIIFFYDLLLRSDPQARRAARSAVACVSISGCSTLKGTRRWWRGGGRLPGGKDASCCLLLHGLAVFFQFLAAGAAVT